ncbi:MAG: hypothetical protein KGZ91_10960 [Afipia sp.]|jgi:hypothetical protein|nr:hypothetical protein [Afipia sp.]WIG53609.1 MAG: hypothetical protein OJF48_004529 [Afipia sp.]
MVTPDIELNHSEGALLAQIEFDWDRHTPEDYKRNSEVAAALTKSLLARKAVPEQRMKYFTDPAYKPGRLKGSHRDLFHRNNNTDEEMIRHVHFLPYLYYFIFGPKLPESAKGRFREQVRRCGQVSSGDAIPLAKFARAETRAMGLVPHEAAEEYFKLALDCGLWISYALHIRDYVNKTR